MLVIRHTYIQCRHLTTVLFLLIVFYIQMPNHRFKDLALEGSYYWCLSCNVRGDTFASVLPPAGANPRPLAETVCAPGCQNPQMMKWDFDDEEDVRAQEFAELHAARQVRREARGDRGCTFCRDPWCDRTDSRSRFCWCDTCVCR